ncbi:RabGAP/TBC GTPase [Chloropicon roscoffensis]|uniref:RabGAP/TBC GTPase n=2 Tax=Chloropicon roscoffensis TaxID=1461544 RepID=A0AAX4PEL9_9CHLO
MWENARRLAAFVAGEDAVAEAKVRREAASTSTSASAPVDSLAMPREWSERQRDKLLEILNKSVVDIEKLQQISWGGIPQDLRPICWQLMLGYLPRQTSSWQDVVNCKRKAYRELLKTHYEVSNSRKSEEELGTLRQIAIDAPRTEPKVKLFGKSALQRSLIRILYIRACTHPSSGYVQGLNDVLTPFLHVFLSRVFPGDMGTWDVDSIHDDKLIDIEGDCYWCFCKLMDRVEDMYTREQPGIRRCVREMETLLKRIDGDLQSHMEKEGLELLHFTVRWFNCLIMRELPFALVCRLWDTYIAEGDNIKSFVVFVALALLVSFSEKLQGMDFQGMIIMLQKLPTTGWTYKDLELILSEAFLWTQIFQDTKP